MRKTSLYFQTSNLGYYLDIDELRRYIATSVLTYIAIYYAPLHYANLDSIYNRLLPKFGLMPMMARETLKDLAHETLKYQGKAFTGSIVIREDGDMRKVQFNGLAGEYVLKQRFDKLMQMSEPDLAAFGKGGNAKEHTFKHIVARIRAWGLERRENKDWTEWLMAEIYKPASWGGRGKKKRTPLVK